jgi:mucin-19
VALGSTIGQSGSAISGLYLSGTTNASNLVLSGSLTSGSDVSANARLFVGSDASFGGRLFANGDVSLNGNVSIGKDLTILGRLNVQNYQNTAIINTTTTNYSLIVSEDLSLNGRIYTSGDASMGGNLFVGKAVTSAGLITAQNGFTVSSGTVNLPASSNISIAGTSVALGGSVTGAQIGPALSSVPNSALTNSSVTIAGTSVALGGSVTGAQIGPALSSVPNSALTNSSVTIAGTSVALGGSVTGAQIGPALSSVPNSALTNSSVTIAGTSVALGGTVSASALGSNITNVPNSALTNSSVNIAGISVALGSSVTGAQLGPAISGVPNSALTNNSVTIAGTTVALGSSVSASIIGSNITNVPNTALVNSNVTIAGTSVALGGSVTGAQIGPALSGVPNSALTNSSVTIAGTAVALGSSLSASFIGSNITNVPNSALVNSNVTIAGTSVSLGGSVTGAQIGPALSGVPNSALTNNSVTIAGTSVALGGSVSAAFLGSNITNVPNSALINSGVTIGSTTVSLGSTIGQSGSAISGLYLGGTTNASNLVLSGTAGLMVTSGDVSMNNRMFVLGDASMAGNLYVAKTIQAGDISANTRLFVGSDASFGGRLFANGDVSLNGSVSIGKDITILGRLNVQNYQNTAIINTTTTNYSLIVSEDLSLNGRIYTSGDASMGGNLFVGKTVTSAGLITAQNGLTVSSGPVSFPVGSIAANAIVGSAGVDLTSDQTIAGKKTFTTTIVGNSDISGNGRLFVGADASFGGKVFISSDVSINGNISAKSIVGYSTNTTTLDSWMLTNLINAPPAVTFGTPTVTSSFIYIPWSYPTQIQVGIFNSYLPLISQLTIQYGTGTSAARSPPIGNLLANATSTDYINNYATNSNPNAFGSSTTPITGVIFAKSNSSAGFGIQPASTLEQMSGTVVTTTFGTDSGTRRALLFYDSAIAAMTNSNSFYVSVYYKNNNTNNNFAYSYPSGYMVAGVPSYPRNVTEPSFTSNSITVQYFDPSYGDITANTTPTAVTAYQIIYKSYSNSVRYGGAVSVGPKTMTGNVPAITTPVIPATTPAYSASTLISTEIYPDASYSIVVAAKNSANDTYGGNSAPIYASTLPLTAPTTNYDISTIFPSTNLTSGTYYSVATGFTVNNLIIESAASARTTGSLTAIVNDFTTRGVKGVGGNMYLAATVSGAATVTGPNIAFNTAFGTAAPSPSTVGNITITPGAFADNYSGITGSDGFYKNITCTMTLETPLLKPSSSAYTVTLTRSSTGLTAAGGSTTYSGSPYSFYYDNLSNSPGQPQITTAFALASTSSAQVCGVNVIYGTPTFTASYTVTNLGNYFYKSPLIQYTSADSNNNSIINTSETTIPSPGTNVTSGKLNNTVTFASMAISGLSVASVFTTSIPLNINAYNIIGNTMGSATSIPAIIDGPSYALVQSMTSIPTLNSTSAVQGSRIWSGSNPGTYELNSTTSFSNASLLTTINSASASYSALSPLYNHAQTIASGTYVGELQIANGKFQTKTSTAYLNYSSLYYSASLQNTGIDYTSISTSGAYRYATFIWKIPLGTVTSSSAAFTSVTFTINSPSTSPYSISYSNNVASIGGKNIQLFYRIEDATTTTTAQVGSSISTSWIDANSKAGTKINSSNYTSPSTYAKYYGVTDTGTTNGTSYSVLIPSPVWTNSTYLYCRIGLPMDVAFSFTSISAALGTDYNN